MAAGRFVAMILEFRYTRVCGVATHAIGGDAGYSLLQLIVPTGYLKIPYNEKAACTLEISKCKLLFFGM